MTDNTSVAIYSAPAGDGKWIGIAVFEQEGVKHQLWTERRYDYHHEALSAIEKKLKLDKTH